MAKGLTLENVIYNKAEGKFDAGNSQFFWFTVLRKLHIHKRDPTSRKSQIAYANLTSFLEENLFQTSGQHEALRSTVTLYLAVEEGDADSAEEILNEIVDSSGVIPYMRALPGAIFPSGSYQNDPVLVTPVALALKQKDIKMLSLLCSFWQKEAMFQEAVSRDSHRERDRVTSLCLEIIREDTDFFKNPVLRELLEPPAHLDNVTHINSLNTLKWSVKVAEVFLAVETKNLEQLKEIVKSSLHVKQLLRVVKDTYVNGRSRIVDEKSLDEWNKSLYIEKSLVLTALERKDLKTFEFLENHGFDVTDLGRLFRYTSGNSQNRNKMDMWYRLIKYLFTVKGHVLIYNLCKKPAIWNGPALVGCLFTAARRKDLALMEEVEENFRGDMNWFHGPKYLNFTAHNLLLKQGLQKEARMLQMQLVDFPTPGSIKDDVERTLRSAVSLENFKGVIDENPEWLTSQMFHDKSLIMLMVTSKCFTVEKFKYLLTEKKADIHMVTTKFDKKQNFVDIMLQEAKGVQRAKEIQDVLQFDEVQEILFNTSNILSDFGKKIVSLSAEERREERMIYVECFRQVVSLSSLEMMFFPTRRTLADNPIQGLFETIQDDHELCGIAAERAFELIGKEENQVTALVHLILANFRGLFQSCGGNLAMKKNFLFLFVTFFISLKDKDRREQAGYTSSLEGWRDRYGMTFMMRLLVDSDGYDGYNLLLQWIIEGGFFDEEYMNLKADTMDLGAQFDLQHRLGVVSANKERNTVVSKDQLVKVKRVLRQNSTTGQYEPFTEGTLGNQVKMVSQNRVQVQEGGVERSSRIMMTVKKHPDPKKERSSLTSLEDLSTEDLCIPEESQEPEDDLGKAVSVDGDVSEGEEDKECLSDLGLPMDDLEKKIGQWTIEGILETNPGKIVEPEHFDKTSVITDTDQTFKTKQNRYKIAPSASTRFMETHSTVEAPIKHFAKRTTLLLLACKTKRWDVARILLENYRLEVNQRDADGTNSLHLVISAISTDTDKDNFKVDLCRLMIESSKDHDLKSEVNADNQNALMLLSHQRKLVSNDPNDENKLNDLNMIEKMIIKKTGQKANVHTAQRTPVDKTQVQQLRLEFGQSCGYQFQLVDGVWRCRGPDCQVQVIQEGAGLRPEDKNHYKRFDFYYSS